MEPSSSFHFLDHAIPMDRPQVISGDATIARCSFVIHPLSAEQLWKHPLLRWVKFTPAFFQSWMERRISQLPVQPYSKLIGIKSAYNGTEVECDLMLVLASPRTLMTMKRDQLENRLIQTSELAKLRGSSIMGLGAYTKVGGDGGVQVTNQASLPVTTGNSLSAACTLWSAEYALKKMRPDLKPAANGRLPIKVMVVGATGSIGRVTAMVLSEKVSDLVLVSRSMEKLDELRKEITFLQPECRVKIATAPGQSLAKADLIITATSNLGKKLFELKDLKAGSIVCDCSRPMEFTREDMASRPDVLFLESGEVSLPGNPRFTRSVLIDPHRLYACLAETLILAMEGRHESYSYSRKLEVEKVKEISALAIKHGARLAGMEGLNFQNNFLSENTEKTEGAR